MTLRKVSLWAFVTAGSTNTPCGVGVVLEGVVGSVVWEPFVRLGGGEGERRVGDGDRRRLEGRTDGEETVATGTASGPDRGDD